MQYYYFDEPLNACSKSTIGDCLRIKNKHNHSLIIKDYGTAEVHFNYAGVFIVDFKYVVNLVIFFLMTLKHVSSGLQVSLSCFSF